MTQREAFLFLMPGCVLLVLLTIVPTLFLVGVALSSWTLYQGPVFGGGINFTRLMGDEYFLHSLKVTLMFTTTATLLEVMTGFFLAFLLTSGSYRRILGFIRLLLLLPILVSELSALSRANLGVTARGWA